MSIRDYLLGDAKWWRGIVRTGLGEEPLVWIYFDEMSTRRCEYSETTGENCAEPECLLFIKVLEE